VTQTLPQLVMQILQRVGDFATAEPGNPGFAEMSLTIDVELESFSLDQSRLLLHANQLIPVYVADEAQCQV
jgi:hypothetical protein